ncbi:MAG: hypothetical protein AB8I08_35095 [Sandaracinaceae bacterium]
MSVEMRTGTAPRVRDGWISGAAVECNIALEPPREDDLFEIPAFGMRVTELHRIENGSLSDRHARSLPSTWNTPRLDPEGNILWAEGQTVEWNGEAPYPLLAALVRLEDRSLLTVTLHVRADIAVEAHPGYAAR